MERAIEIKLSNMKRFGDGAREGTREKAVTRRPEEPKPAIARPAMRAGELGAAPQTAEPTRKTNMAAV